MKLLRKTLVFCLFLCLPGSLVLAYEEPEYTVVKTYDDFELRQYEAYIVAETNVSGSFDDVGNQAFRKLFRYISEDQRPQGKIAMTTPVIQQPSEADNQETSQPANAKDKGYRFAFVMPAEFSFEDLPEPDDVAVQLSEVPARMMAARRYSGTWSEERYRKNEKILLDGVKAAGLQTVGAPLFARYNAPFSLWFLRRNEVLIAVANPVSP